MPLFSFICADGHYTEQIVLADVTTIFCPECKRESHKVPLIYPISHQWKEGNSPNE